MNTIGKLRSELEELMRKVFSAFDKDGSGAIDAGELRLISKDMGRELDPTELDECMKDLDINKDNKVTYDEFSKWWLSGR
jgi:Ca2+-binding EF-hand superfamily protein